MDLSRSLWIDRAVLLLCLLPAAACKFKGVTSNVASTSSQAYDFSGYCDTKIAAQCSQAVSIDGQNNLAVYRTKPIDPGHPDETVASILIVIHGANGATDEIFDAAAKAVGANSDVASKTALIVPFFGSKNTPAPPHGSNDILDWGPGGKGGPEWANGTASSSVAMSSFLALNNLAARALESFPKATQITFAGHSAGGQTVQRYAAMSTGLPPGSTAKVRFVVMSPGSYMYFGKDRILATAKCTGPSNCSLKATDFGPVDASSACASTYNTYKYGTDGLPEPLAGWFNRDYKGVYATNDVSYLVNTGDATDSPHTHTGGLPPFDTSCEANTQGPVGNGFRMQRGLTFFNYLQVLGAQTNVSFASHNLYVLDGASMNTGYNGGPCEHDEPCVFGSPIGTQLLLGTADAAGQSLHLK